MGEVSLTISEHRGASVISEGVRESEQSLFGDRFQAHSADIELLQLLREDFDDLVITYPLVRKRIESIGKIREQNKAAANDGAGCIVRLAASEAATATLKDGNTTFDKLRKLSRTAGAMPRTGSFHDLSSMSRQIGKSTLLSAAATA